jgi:hypothetical protein
MLTIKDLSASNDLDRDAMTTVRGGSDALTIMPVPGFAIANAPTIDVGAHFLAQGQSAVIGQGGNLGGFNAVANWQYQNGVAGQVVG